MVELRHVRTYKCPVCGCTEVVSETIETEFGTNNIRYHANGGRWETREFACGYKVQFVPNFGNETVKKKCALDPGDLEKRKKHLEDCCKLIDFINENNIENDVVRSVYNNLCYEVSI